MFVFLKGAVIGFSIAAPVGPIGLLCIRRSVTFGRTTGLVSGLGAATADTVCGLLAALGLTSLTGFLIHHRGAVQGIGGVAMVVIGMQVLLEAAACAPKSVASGPGTGADRPGCAPESAPRLAGAFLSTLGLTLTNPLTLISFTSVLAGAGVGHVGPMGPEAAGPGVDWTTIGLVGAGVFSGSAAWWFILSTVASWLGARLKPGLLRTVNGLAGAGIALFGAAFVFVVAHRILGR